MPDYPEIYVIRHGQTEWNLAGRYQGRLDSPLTALGRDQAGSVGRILAREIDQPQGFSFVASPQKRALRTAELAMEKLPQPLPSVQTDNRLCEVSFGQWEGATIEEIRRDWPEHMCMAEEGPMCWQFMSPGGETLVDIEQRVEAFLGELTDPAVIFTHGVTSHVLRAHWLGLQTEEMPGWPAGQGVIFHLSQGLGQVVLEK